MRNKLSSQVRMAATDLGRMDAFRDMRRAGKSSTKWNRTDDLAVTSPEAGNVMDVNWWDGLDELADDAGYHDPPRGKRGDAVWFRDCAELKADMEEHYQSAAAITDVIDELQEAGGGYIDPTVYAALIKAFVEQYSAYNDAKAVYLEYCYGVA